jgi:hypothetical protein
VHALHRVKPNRQRREAMNNLKKSKAPDLQVRRFFFFAPIARHNAV